MAITLAGNASWSTCNGGNPPGATDDIYLNGYALTLDGGNNATYTCNTIKARASNGTTLANGTINPGASTPYTLACRLFAGVQSLLTNPVGSTITSLLYAEGGSTSRHGVVNNGTITTVTGCKGTQAATQNTSYGVSNTATGVITTLVSATGGAGAGACPGCYNAGTITTVQLATGGSGGTGNYGLHNEYGSIGTVTSAVGDSGTSSYGVYHSGGTITTVTSCTGGSGTDALGIYVQHGAITNPVGVVKGGSHITAFGFGRYPLGVGGVIGIASVDLTGVAAPIGIKNLRLCAGVAMGGVNLAGNAAVVCVDSAGVAAAADVRSGTPRYTGGPNGTLPAFTSIWALR